MRTDTPHTAQQYRPTTDQTAARIDPRPTGSSEDREREETGTESPGRTIRGADTPTPDAEPTDDPAGWVARCQRSFDPSDTSRLANTTDEANQAMPTTD